ncbi:glucose-6-phosphate isomerase [Leisingera sp. SS27]|uniref:glucose-6-phosphate isomerase n=1 Tax=Leisingera sp. SS27 TaxID=2979462 RepID=UPI00232B1159|nr:glucose-6-phosphate isomerase [Leisingera sp. SS27]MDC0657787.1 glucose-6-phosphate isomerase [Leisingera sp. SS27]
MHGIWKTLEDLHAAVAERPILGLFDDPQRFQCFSAETDGLLLDYSKTNLDEDILQHLIALAEESGVPDKRDAMFQGARSNATEGRAVLHTALRSPDTAVLAVGGEDVRPEIKATRDSMERFAEGVRTGTVTAPGGRAFTDVVNIGIGGSDLGPLMAVRALAPYHTGPRCHFVSNVDGAQISDTLDRLNPRTTLFIIASKTFTTVETMTNARTAFRWLEAAVGSEGGGHLAAVSSAPGQTAVFGIPEDRVFSFADWVGGRYSLWGPVGLPIMMAIGAQKFGEFLAGGNQMDQHFRSAPLRKNLPVLMALVGIWHNNVCGYTTRVVLPYDQRLDRLPAYLQQLDMESNGKRVDCNGEPLQRASGPIVWGESGTNGQHAFYQLLHQGTQIIPAEFLIAAESHEPHLKEHHDLLKANCLAQSEALMRGRSLKAARKLTAGADAAVDQDCLARHRTFPGNRPSVTLAYSKLSPFVLGQLIALYEHRVFAEGVIWNINSFDQWGVELGKELAISILPLVQGDPADGKDGSTRGLLAKLAN